MQAQGPLVSVIVPAYKTAAFLPKCLDSIIHQTYRNLEIICVDDGSPDNSGEILEEYAKRDSRIKVIRRKNGGLSAARNSGLAAATGEWVTGVDSDDWLEPDIYREAVSKLSAQVDILVFGTRLVYEPGVQSENLEAYFTLPAEGVMKPDDVPSPYINVCFCNKLCRRSLVERLSLRFPEKLLHEDEYFYRCLAPHAKGIYVLPREGYNYVQRAGSIIHSGKTPWAKYWSLLPLVEKMLEFHLATESILRAKEYILAFWMLYFQCACVRGCPRDFFGHALRVNKSVVSRYHLEQLYPQDLRLLRLQPLSWWKRPFMKVYSNRVSYRFFCIPLYSLVYENNLPHHRDSAWFNILSRWFRGIRR